ncbi:AMP-binding protein, partial [Sphingobium sp. CECT 9361]|uniref:AMP-binding protein n=1 Tax=Sphingobium sp. CECT 9361 TaxID=2845384 RepID=UPI0033B2425B
MIEEKDVLPGLMQNAQLNIADVLRFASVAHGDREIVSKNVDEPIWRYDYAGAWTRAAQAAHALVRLGVAPGDRVSSLAWNTHRHFELFFAV